MSDKPDALPVLGGPFDGGILPPGTMPDDDGFLRIGLPPLGRIAVYRLSAVRPDCPAWVYVASCPDYSESRCPPAVADAIGRAIDRRMERP